MAAISFGSYGPELSERHIYSKFLYQAKDLGTVAGASRAFAEVISRNFFNPNQHADKFVSIYLSLRIQTKDSTADQKLVRQAVEKGLNIRFQHSVSSAPPFYEISIYLSLKPGANVEKRLTPAVAKLNAFAAEVYSLKEAGQFDGSEKGKPPTLELIDLTTPPTPLVEEARS